MQCFNTALERLSADPRVTVRLGKADDLRAFGSMAETRLGRQQIPHQVSRLPRGRATPLPLFSVVMLSVAPPVCCLIDSFHSPGAEIVSLIDGWMD